MSKKGPRTPNPVVEAREATGISKMSPYPASMLRKGINGKRSLFFSWGEGSALGYPRNALVDAAKVVY